MDFDESSSSSSTTRHDDTTSSDDELPMFAQPKSAAAQKSPSRSAYRDPEDLDEVDSAVDDTPLKHDNIEDVVTADADEDAGPPAEIPEWALNLQRPMTSATVGRFSNRRDEFTRHMQFPEQPDVQSDGDDEESTDNIDRPDDVSDRCDDSSPLGQLRSDVRSGGGAELENGVSGDDEDFPVTDSVQWQVYLESGLLVDETPFTQVYRVVEEASAREEEEDDHASAPPPAENVSMFKVLNPPLPDDAIATDFDRVKRLSQRICRAILKNAECIAQDEALSGKLMCGIQEVHCDSQARVIVQLQHMEPTVTLSDIAAFTTVTSEHIRILATKVVHQLCALHDRNIVHGVLHGGNVLVNSETGALVFTDGCGLLSCPVLAPDLSFVSPHLASHLRELLPTDIDVHEQPNSFMNDLWSAFYEDPYQESPRDDAYAVAQLVALCVNGFPSRFGKSIAGVVAEVDLHPAPVLLNTSTGGEYFRMRASVSGFTEEYLHQAQSFMDALMSTDTLQTETILEHPFLLSAKQLEAEPELHQQMAEFSVQIATEAAKNIAFSKEKAGSQPMNIRLFRNSLFAHNAAAAGVIARCEEPLTTQVEQLAGVRYVGADTVVVEGDGVQVISYHSFPAARTKLVVRNLTNSSVVLLSSFRHVVIHNVSDSSVALGPCQTVLIEDVARCPRIALAAHRVMLRAVDDLELALHAVEVPVCPDPSTVLNLRIVPYCIAYPGLTFDFASVAVAQESQSSLLNYQSTEGGSGTLMRAPLELFPNWRTGHDYPYLRSLATTGNRILHQRSLSDLYLFSGEATGCKVVIEDICGGLVSNCPQAACGAPASPARSNKYVFPVIMIVDSVEDVFISDCENVTIVVIGATSSINVSNVKKSKLFLGGTYVMLSDCSQCEVYGFAVKGAMVEDCESLQVMPLAADFPNIDAVMTAVVQAAHSSESAELDVTENIFATPRVQQRHNKETVVSQRPQCLFTMPSAAFGAAPSSHFASQVFPAAMVLPLSKCIYDGQQVVSDRSQVLQRSSEVTVVISQLVDGSLLRVAGTLCPARPGDQGDTACNLLITHLDTGVVHIADAVGNLTVANCTGPLDIIVAAAQQVTIINCTNVTLQVACFAFTASACASCHFALHVNTEPRLEGCCRNISVSALNVTCANYEDVLDRSSVQQHVNLFDRVVDADRPVDASTDPYVAAKRAAKGDAAASDAAPPRVLQSVESLLSISDATSGGIKDVSSARRLLDREWYVVPPLPGTCVGACDAPFLEGIEDRVAKESSDRSPLDTHLMAALSMLAQEVDDADGAQAIAASGGLRVNDSSMMSYPPHRSPSGSPQRRSDTEDLPARPSARLGHSGGMEENYDSSSDEEAEDTPSPVKASQPAMQGTPAQQLDKSSSSTPPLRESPARPLAFGSMTAGACSDSDSSDEACSPTKEASESPSHLNDSPTRSSKAKSSSPNPLRNEVDDFKTFLKQQSVQESRRSDANDGVDDAVLSTTTGATRQHSGGERYGYDSDDSFSENDGEDLHDDAAVEKYRLTPPSGHDAPSSNSDVTFHSSSPRSTDVPTSADDAMSAVRKCPPKKSSLGFDDSSDDDDSAPRKTSAVSREAAAHAMGITASMSVFKKKTNIVAVPQETLHAATAQIDISENPLSNLRASRVPNASHHDEGTSSSSPPEKSDPPLIPTSDVFASDASPDEQPAVSDPDTSTVSPDDKLDPGLVPDSDVFSQNTTEHSPAARSATSPEDSATLGPASSVSAEDRTLVFLDIDGVIVPVSPMCFGGGDIDEACLGRLADIIDACGGVERTTVVLTSTWRHDDSKKQRLNEAFKKTGRIPQVFLGVSNGVPNSTLGSVTYFKKNLEERKLVCDRVDEIFFFLSENEKCFPEAARGRWFAIDDMDLGVDSRMNGHFLKTDTEDGLSSADVAAAKALIEHLPSSAPTQRTSDPQLAEYTVPPQMPRAVSSPPPTTEENNNTSFDSYQSSGDRDPQLVSVEPVFSFECSSSSPQGSASLVEMHHDAEYLELAKHCTGDEEKLVLQNTLAKIKYLRSHRELLRGELGDYVKRIDNAVTRLSSIKGST